jgi:hypothetical protein
MLVFKGLGLAPRQGSTGAYCTTVDPNGVCVQGSQLTNYGGWGGGMTASLPTYQSTGLQRTLPASPTATFQAGSSGGWQVAPTSTPPVVQPPFPSGAVPLPTPVAVPPVIDPAPSQQPPPVGLPEQPALQPGVQVTDQSTYVELKPFPYVKFGLAALVAALAGAGLGVVIRRRHRAAAT